MKILKNQLTEGSYARNSWVLKGNFSREEILRPETWAHVAGQIHAGDHIEILSPDGSWWAEFVVRTVDGVEVVMGLINSAEFESVERVADDYKVVWAGPTAKFRVVRVADGVIVKEGIASKVAAEAFCSAPLENAA